MSVFVTLNNGSDVCRGDMICRVHNQPRVSRDVGAIQHTTRWAWAERVR